MSKMKKIACIFLLAAISQSYTAFAREFYTVTIVCPQGSGMAGNRIHSVSAENDLDAMNQANKILFEQSIYKNKGCLIKEVKRG